MPCDSVSLLGLPARLFVSTFRYSFRQKKPDADAPLMRLLCSGVSLSGSARLLGIDPGTVARKLRRLGRHILHLQIACLRKRVIRGHFQLDEMETIETNRFQPVTVPVLIEKNSFFILGTGTAPLRRRGRMTTRQKNRRAGTKRATGAGRHHRTPP